MNLKSGNEKLENAPTVVVPADVSYAAGFQASALV
jgi:hypothetical protein